MFCTRSSSAMEWTNNHDVLLCREILLIEPYTAKQRTQQRGQLWQSVADHLNEIHEPTFRVSKRGVRDRYNLLVEKFKKKMRVEEKASGIDTEMTELDSLLEEIIGREESCEGHQQNEATESRNKAEQSKADANDMRLQAMETLKESKKRKADNECATKKRTRSRGSDAVQYLREKIEEEKEMRVAEHNLKEQDLEMKRRHQEMVVQQRQQIENQHREYMTMLQSQQQAMQQMQVNFMNTQQQKNQLLVSLLAKITKK